MDISLLCCALSVHLTDMYTPDGGYNETHESIGVHVEETFDKHAYGLQAMTFKDSFDKNSALYALTYVYELDNLWKLQHNVGAGVGYVETSYYSGPIILPVYEIGYNRFALQNSVFPPAFGSEALFMTQLKIKLYEEK